MAHSFHQNAIAVLYECKFFSKEILKQCNINLGSIILLQISDVTLLELLCVDSKILSEIVQGPATINYTMKF